MNWFKRFILAFLVFGCCSQLTAKIDFVTLPMRDSVQISIYNSVDLTLVKESRTLSLKKGINRLQFSWAGTLIDPTSLDLKFLENPASFEIIDVTFPALISNTLVWHIQSEIEGAFPVEIRYFTSGLTWSADYVVIANDAETTLDIEALVKVTNKSGEDYHNTQTRMIVGEINLVEEIARLAAPMSLKKEARLRKKGAYGAITAAVSEAEMADRAKVIKKEGVSEYFLYTVEGRETILNNWSKRLKSFSVQDISFKLMYRFDEHKHGGNVVKIYEFKNDEEHKLGKEPLPNGVYRVFKKTGSDGLSFVNQYSSKYTPVKKKIELILGSDGLIKVETKKMNFRRYKFDFSGSGKIRGWVTETDYLLKVRNSKDIPVPIEILKHFSGDWKITMDEQFERVDMNTIKFRRDLKSRDMLSIRYKITEKFGSRASK